MSLSVPERVRVVEVGPRDGLQNEALVLPVAERVALIEALADAGLAVVEAGSLVSPGRVPAMAGTAAVLAALRRREGVAYPVLVPNRRGLEDALAAGAREVAVFAAASETFSRRNIGRGVADSLQEYGYVVADARAAGLWVRGYVSCTLGCPYEGAVAPGRVAEVAGALYTMGCAEVSLGDTIGVGTPVAARAMLSAVAERMPVERLAVHFHDTYGQALANVLAALDLGVCVVDSAVAGLGGCPFAPGAAGNLATEDLLYMLDGIGVATGVDLSKVARTGRRVTDLLGRGALGMASRAARALAAREPA